VNESLGHKIDRLNAADRNAKEEKAALEAALEKAKPKAFATFEAKAKEAAELLRSRSIPVETSKIVVLRFEKKKKFLSSQVVRIPVYGTRISGWILYQSVRSTDRGNAKYNFDPTWLGGMVMDTDGALYSFEGDKAVLVTLFDEAVSAIGSSNAYSLDGVDELAALWEDKVFQATARAVRGEPYEQP
jgi:hypothetical protein